MSTEITTAFVKQYSDLVYMLAQQKKSRLRMAVRNETIEGEEEYFDQVDSVSATKRTTRHQPTPTTSTPHSRRQVTTSTYEHADLIDRADRVRLLIDPTSVYVNNMAAAFGRTIDDEIITAFGGSANTGKEGGTAVTFPAIGNGFDVAVDFGDTGGDEIMKTEKLMEAHRILSASENDENEPWHVAVGAAHISDLLTEDARGTGTLAFAPAAHGDFGSSGSLKTATLEFYSGFNFHRTERLDTDAGGDERCWAWAQNCNLVAFGMEPQARISERDDLSYSTQVFYTMDVGATRMDETGTVAIACSRTVAA